MKEYREMKFCSKRAAKGPIYGTLAICKVYAKCLTTLLNIELIDPLDPWHADPWQFQSKDHLVDCKCSLVVSNKNTESR